MADRTPQIETRKRSNSSSSSVMRTQTVEQNITTLRRGKWSKEEELYAEAIISYFHKGLIPNIATGTTLRTYLSDQLQCDPMRITKKFAGACSIGKQVFHLNSYTTAQYTSAETDLNHLEKNFHIRIGTKITSSNSALKFAVAGNASSSSNINFDESDDEGDDKFDKGSQFERVKLFRGPNDRCNQTTSIRRVISAPDMSLLYNDTVPEISFRSLDEMASAVKADYSSLRRKDRSQSAMDLKEFERLIADDQAAGSLLMDFYEKMQDNCKSTSTDEKTDNALSGMLTTLKVDSDHLVSDTSRNSYTSSPEGLSLIDIDSLDIANNERIIPTKIQSLHPFGF